MLNLYFCRSYQVKHLCLKITESKDGQKSSCRFVFFDNTVV